MTSSNQINRLFIALLAAGVALSSLPACSSDDESSSSNQEENNQEENNQEEEAAELPAQLFIDLNPHRETYVVGTEVTAEADLYDAQGDPFSGDVDVEWTINPTNIIDLDDDEATFEVTGQGRINIEGCVIDPNDGSVTDICNDRRITASDGMGAIVLETPVAGDHFSGEDTETISVTGQADPALVDGTVQINGQTVSTDASGNFEYELEPVFGINTIDVRAFDGVNTADSTATVSVMWAPEYMPLDIDTDAGTLGTQNDQALILSLGQNFFDDGTSYTEASDSLIIAEDLGDIVEVLLKFLDITDQIPDPVVDQGAFSLSVPDVHIGEPVVEIDVTDDGIELFGQIPSLTAETEGFIELTDEASTIDLSGHIEAGVAIFAAIDIEKAGPDDDVLVDLTDFEIAIEQAQPNFDSDEANALFELADSVLRDQLNDILFDAIDLSFVDALPTLMEELFESLDGILDNQQFDLELEDFGIDLLVNLDGQVGQLTPIAGEGIEGFVSAGISMDADPVYPDAMGVPVEPVEDGVMPFFSGGRLQLGINASLLNAVMHAVWNAGLLDLDVTEQLGDEIPLVNGAILDGRLQPIVRPAAKGEPYDIVLHAGQVEIELDVDDISSGDSQQDRFGADIQVGANLDLSGGDISISISDEPSVHIWLIDSTESSPVVDQDQLLTLVEGELWPMITEELGDGLAFDLPLPELDMLADFAPELGAMELILRQNRDLSQREGYLMLDATLEGEIPLP